MEAVTSQRAEVPAPFQSRSPTYQQAFIIAVDELCKYGDQIDNRYVHERCVERYKQMGWTYGPVMDIARKVSPYMAPYEQLQEDELIKTALIWDLCRIAAKYIR